MTKLISFFRRFVHSTLVVLVSVSLWGTPVMAQEQELSHDDGWESLFDGKTLEGWYAIKTYNPRDLEGMTADELAQRIDKAAASTGEHWRVENGEIVNDGTGPYLTSQRNFRDFELMLEYKTVAKADSGIYLKATPQVQIWDTTREGGKWNIGADKGSGGLWNNSPNTAGKDPLVLADKPFGEWNAVRIRQIGSRTSVWLNGKRVVDHAVMENYWNRKLPLVAKGPVQLQTHGGEIRWRNIKVKELKPEEANAVLSAKSSSGFESVFNGKDFAGWGGPVNNYEIENGVLRCKRNAGGTIYTEKKYSDFVARLEFRLPPGGNNGLAIRYPGKGDTAYVGMCELQVLDNTHPKFAKLDKRQYHGSAYGMVAAHRGYLRNPGEWNFQEVTVVGSKIKVELNGTVILDCDLGSVSNFMADRPHPGVDNPEGHFGFAGHSDPVEFRNVQIKTLDK